MAVTHRDLVVVRREFAFEIRKAIGVVVSLNEGISLGKLPKGLAEFSDEIVEAAFLKYFKAWETFIEHAFVLYMTGKTAPKGRAPIRYCSPPSREFALQWLLPERGTYTEWIVLDDLKKRSQKFFKDGRPIYDALASSGAVLQEAAVIRNAVAHPSEKALKSFQNVVRQKLTVLPPRLTVGSYLNLVEPASSPPARFIEQYGTGLLKLAELIVPT